MRSTLALAVPLCVAPMISGCFGPAISRVDPAQGFKVVQDLSPNDSAGAQSPDEPAFCLAGVWDARPEHGHKEAFALLSSAAPFRAFRAVGSDDSDIANCDVLLWAILDAHAATLNPFSSGGYRGEKLDIVSARTGRRFDYLWASGDDDAPLRLLGRALHALFVPGGADFEAFQTDRAQERVSLNVAAMMEGAMAPIANYGPGAGAFAAQAADKAFGTAAGPMSSNPVGAVDLAQGPPIPADVPSYAPVHMTLAEAKRELLP